MKTLLVLILLISTPSWAAEKMSVYDTNSKRLMDIRKEGNQYNVYNTSSKRIGYARKERSDPRKVQVYSTTGKRLLTIQEDEDE